MQQNFFKEHVIITTILSVVVCFFISLVVGQLIAKVLFMAAGMDMGTISTTYFTASFGKIIAIGCAFLLLHLAGLLPKIKTEHGQMEKGGWILFLLMVAVALYNIIGDGLANQEVAYSEFHIGAVIAAVLYAFVTAVLEELVCRVLLFQNMCQKWKNREHGMLGSVLVSSIVFGICHLLNISAGVGVTLFQVYYAIVAGILFAVLYLLSRNIWLSILSHFLIDFCGCIGYACMPNHRAMELAAGMSPIDIGALCVVAGMTIGAVYALSLLRGHQGENF